MKLSTLLQDANNQGRRSQGQLPPLPFAYGGMQGQLCALRYHYNILYFLLNLFYHYKFKFILPKFVKLFIQKE